MRIPILIELTHDSIALHSLHRVDSRSGPVYVGLVLISSRVLVNSRRLRAALHMESVGLAADICAERMLVAGPSGGATCALVEKAKPHDPTGVEARCRELGREKVAELIESWLTAKIDRLAGVMPGSDPFIRDAQIAALADLEV